MKTSFLGMILATALAAAPQGESLIAAGGVAALEFRGSATVGSVEPVAGPGGEEGAVRATIRETGNPGSLQLRTLNAIEAKRDQVCLFSFRARMVEPAVPESDTGEARAVVEHNGAPFVKSLSARVILTREWQEYHLPFRVRTRHNTPFADGYAPGTLRIGFHLGGRPQVIELADFSAQAYGPETDFETLPRTMLHYEGREPDAAWRQPAAERIRRHRMADLTVRVVDAQGRPVPNADIAVEMLRHEFRWGTAVSAYMFKDPPAFMGSRPLPDWLPESDVRRYSAEVERLFNTAVFEADMKHPSWWRHRDVLQVRQWFVDRRIELRGHTLVWQNWRFLPEADRERLQAAAPAELQAYILDHLRTATETFRGMLYDWDVVNEPYANHVWTDRLGYDAMAEWFRTAQAVDPGCRMTLCEGYGVIANLPVQDNLLRTLDEMRRRDAPVTGLGIHGHIAPPGVPPEQVYASLERLAAPGLPLQITEFDFDCDDEELAADYLRDFLTIVFSHPAMDGFLMWGFWDGRHWLGNAPLFRKDWSLKPSGQVYIDLVLGDWWTRERGTTDHQGLVRVRCFRGEHRVRVNTHEQTVQVGADGAELVVRLP